MNSKAWWIWPEHPERLLNRYAQYRREFQVEKIPERLVIHITADQQYQLWVNGRYVARGPARGYASHWPYDTIDLAPFLVVGANALSVLAHNPGVGTFQYQHHKAAGLLIWPEDDAWAELLTTNATWRCRIDPSHAVDTPELSLQLSWQEHVDLRSDDRRWITDSAFDSTGWGTPRTSRPMGAPPWHALEPRGLPMLTDTVMAYREACFDVQGDEAQGLEPFVKKHPTAQYLREVEGLCWTSATPAATVGDALVLHTPAVKAQRFYAVSVDMGQPTVGTPLLEIQGATAGQRVDVLFCEAIKDDGTPVIVGPADNHCIVGLAMRLTLAGEQGQDRFEAFQIIGHRYAVVVVRGEAKPMTLRLAVRETVYPLQVEGRFETDNQTINDIHRICVRAQRVCMLDSYVDTPWREQAQWWGDARVTTANTFHLANDPRLLRRGIRQIGDPDQELPNGLSYGHAPTIAHGCVLPDFSLIWMLTLYDDYAQTGEPTMYLEQRDRLQRMLGYFTTVGEGVGENGLLRYDPRYWLFLDWADKLPRQGTPTLLNLWYLQALERLAELAQAAGLPDDARRYGALRRQTLKAVDALLWNEKAGLYRDGLDDAGKPIEQYSVHNQTLAVLCGLRPQRQQDMLAQRILPYLRGQTQDGANPSSYWVTYVYTAAQQLGQAQAVLDHLVKHWQVMIPFGGTFEQFNVQLGHGSCTHAWSAHPIYHLAQILGGVTRLAPGWSRVSFEPLLTATQATRVNLRLPTPHGPITVAWQRTGDHAGGTLSLPPGIEATANVPGQAPATVTGTFDWSVELPGKSVDEITQAHG